MKIYFSDRVFESCPMISSIIEHDTMSLQSLTSLGRIGRILGGTDSSGNNN